MEECGISEINSLEKRDDLYFEVLNFSPVRGKNYLNKTHVFLAKTEQEIDLDSISDDEKTIQEPEWKSIDEIRYEIYES